MSLLRMTLGFAWAIPWTLFGLMLGTLGLVTGGRVRRHGRILEFWGGCLPWFLRRCMKGAPVGTFGHVVLGRSARHLDACRAHELVHVRQYERWGPLLVPMYLLCWLGLWLGGKHPYYDNPFERQAYEETLYSWNLWTFR